MSHAIFDWPNTLTVLPWCKVFHQFTEKCTIGTLMTPMMARKPAARAPWRRSSNAWYRPITPRYRNSSTSSEVSRASQVHHVPHIGLPHTEQVTRVRKVNAAPIGADGIAPTSASFERKRAAYGK